MISISDIVKWGILAALLATFVVTLFAFPHIGVYQNAVAYLESFDEDVGPYLTQISDYLLYARKIINYFAPPYLITAVIVLSIIRKPLFLALESITAFIRAIYK